MKGKKHAKTITIKMLRVLLPTVASSIKWKKQKNDVFVVGEKETANIEM